MRYWTTCQVRYWATCHVRYWTTCHVRYWTNCHVRYWTTCHVRYWTTCPVRYWTACYVTYYAIYHVILFLFTTNIVLLVMCFDLDWGSIHDIYIFDYLSCDISYIGLLRIWNNGLLVMWLFGQFVTIRVGLLPSLEGLAAPGSNPGMSYSEPANIMGNHGLCNTCLCVNLLAEFLTSDCCEGVRTCGLWVGVLSRAIDGRTPEFLGNLIALLPKA